jgi:hypothetical protein
MDTVIVFGGSDFRFSQEYALEYRNQAGVLDLDALVMDNLDELLSEDMAREYIEAETIEHG